MNDTRHESARDAKGFEMPSPMLLGMFQQYIRWYLWRHFHAVRTLHLERLSPDPRPTIVVMSHASWWDPLIGMHLWRLQLPEYRHYGPMDAAALGHYGFFRKLGVFPVEQGTLRGAAGFLRTSMRILSQPNSMLWMTPQGEFTDVRERPVSFKPGLGALVHRMGPCRLLPLAMEYAFWNERLPEILLNFGEPLFVEDGGAQSAEAWTAVLEQRMETTLDELASASKQRNAALFQTVTRGGKGVGGMYEAWQRVHARMRGETYKPEHGSIHGA